MTSGWTNRFNSNTGSCDGRNVLNTARQIIRLLLSVEEHVTYSDNGDDDKHMCKHIALILLRSKG